MWHAATTSTASARARLEVIASRASHSGELGAMGLCWALDTSTDVSPSAATGSGTGSTRGANGALAVSLGPAAAHRPHRGRWWRWVGTAARQALVSRAFFKFCFYFMSLFLVFYVTCFSNKINFKKYVSARWAHCWCKRQKGRTTVHSCPRPDANVLDQTRFGAKMCWAIGDALTP
jgi:hypothetical protein